MSQISQVQRYEIQLYLEKNFSIPQISNLLGRPKKTIYQEIKRNSDQRNGIYKADLAQRKSDERKKEKRKSIRFTQEIKEDVNRLLKENYSPEQITGSLKRENKPFVSHETIYKYIWENKKEGGKLYKHLRTRGKKYKKRAHLKDNRGIIAERKDIEERPKIVEERSRIGDYEVDLVHGANHRTPILTFNDRATGYTFLKHLKGKNAEEIKKNIYSIIKDNQLVIHTLTSDNGKEFSKHKELSDELKFDYYFARPYQSWQRGSNENYNRLLRQYFPKGSDFTKITTERLKEVQDKLNERPRKRFGYMSPKEVYLQAVKNNGKVNLQINN